MAFEIPFLVTLFILIGFGVFFVVFMMWLKSQFPHPLMMKVLSTLHASLFGYETALIELIGPRGYKSHVFPKIVEVIKEIRGEDPLIDQLFKAKTAKEAMSGWLEILKMTKITKEGKIVDRGNNEYEIHIPDCAMCDPIHEIIGDAKGICPMALILASASAIVEQEKVPEIEYSEFHPTGTITHLKFVQES